MSCPSGWCPAGRTNKEEVLCCVDKQGCWRSACGRSLVSFYPGWDGSLETDLSMWKQEKILIVCARVNIFFSCRLLVWTTCAVSQLLENTASLCQQTFHGWCSMKAARCWGGQLTAALSLPSHSSHSFLQPKAPPSAPPPFHFPGQDFQALREQVQWASLPCDVSVQHGDSHQSSWGLDWKRPLAQRYQGSRVFKHAHWRWDAAKTQRTS